MDDVLPRSWKQRISRATRGISVQLIALLSIALFPVGAIAVSQSLIFDREARKSAETLLLSLTAEGASVEHRLLQTGFKAADRLVAGVIANQDSQQLCNKLLADFIAKQDLFSFASFAKADGAVQCASAPSGAHFSNAEGFVRMAQTPVRFVYRVKTHPAVESWTLVTAVPVKAKGVLLGFLSIAVPSLHLPPLETTSGIPRPTSIIVVNASGDLLTTDVNLEVARNNAIAPEMLDSLLEGADRVVDGRDLAGVQATFVKVTLIPDTAYAIGTWPKDNPITQSKNVLLDAILFPALMWFAGMSVAILAARRLVIRPIQTLRSAMRRFALGERYVSVTAPASAPLEIQEVVKTFNNLERIIERNEGSLAAVAEEKLLLLREVHHRIKNNLQMISSIISIQRRKTKDEGVKLVLSSLQNRVLSIAAVDQSLYQDNNTGDVRANDLIRTITDRLIAVNLDSGHQVDVVAEFDEVMLQADQISPLSLLANEAVTNALKYFGAPAGGKTFVRIELTNKDGLVRFEVVNSIAPGLQALNAAKDGACLGMHLMHAFADQLNATFKSGANEADHTFRLSLEFRPSAADAKQAGDRAN